MHAHDLLLVEDLPDGFQQLRRRAGVLLAEPLHGRLPDEVGPYAACRLRDDEQPAPIVAGSIEQLGRHGHGRQLREVGGPARELAPALDEDGAVTVGQVLRLLFPGRLMEGDPDGAALQGFGEALEPRERDAGEGVELDGHPAPVRRRDRPEDVGRLPPVAAVEDSEQIGAAVPVNDVVGFVDEEGPAPLVNHAEKRRGADRAGEERVGGGVVDAFEQR